MIEFPWITVALVLSGRSLDAAQVSAALEALSHPKAGVVKVQGAGDAQSGPAAGSGWEWRMEISRKSDDATAVVLATAVADAVEELFATISNRQEPFGKIPGVERAYLDIQVVFSSSEPYEGWLEFDLNRSQMERARQLGLGLKCGIRPAAKPVG